MTLETHAGQALRLVLTVAGLAIAAVLALRITVPLLESRLAFFPPRGLLATPETFGLPYEEVPLTTADGVRLHAWFVPAGAEAPAGAGAAPAIRRRPLSLILFHGNAENIGDGVSVAALTRAAGHNVLLVDYRGYGRSEGSPSEKGIYRDGEAALAALRARPGVDPEGIVVWGRSIGGAVAVHLAASQPVRAVILESPFTSVHELLREGGYGLMAFLARFGTYRFDSASRIVRVRAPLLVVHGTGDEIIPFALGRRLHDLAPGPREFLAIEGGGHNDLWARHARDVWGGIAAFLERLKVSGGDAGAPAGGAPASRPGTAGRR
ncbi:MAG: alpha/beta hydrolase [Candidatus Polarisedimenticolia bacterium]